MTPNSTRRRGKVYRYYLCLRAERGERGSCPVRCLSAGEIERTVIDQLRAVLRTPEILAQTYREARAQAGEAVAPGRASASGTRRVPRDARGDSLGTPHA